MPEKGIKVTVTDLATGETDEAIIWDDYILVIGDYTVLVSITSTHVITVKADKEKTND
jgi:hypothetical protein